MSELKRRLSQLDRTKIPDRLVPLLIRARAGLAWRDPSTRERCLDEMRLLMSHRASDGELKRLARARAHYKMRRAEMRWHPELITHQKIVGLDQLTGRDLSRPLVLNFMHHAQFDGFFPSLARSGVVCHIVADDFLGQAGADTWLAQHLRVASSGGSTIVYTSVGFQGLVSVLQPGRVLAIASDVPGSTKAQFLGREFMMSSGAARLAKMTDSPVVVATSHKGSRGEPFVRLAEPLEPRSYAEPLDLLEAMLALHEPAIAAWPEFVEDPLAFWRPADSS